MAQKKCPKCGEDNPSEAVMCWACYTPLSGGAAVAAGAGGGTVVAPMPGVKGGNVGAGDEGSEKKKLKLEPKQIGIAAAVVVALGLAVFMNLPKGEEPPDETPNAPAAGGAAAPAPPPPPAVSGPAFVPAGSAPLPAPGPLPHSVMVAPDPRQASGTMAILPNQTNLSTRDAASLAAFAKDQYFKMKKWQGFQVYVFGNAQAAQKFKDYQNQRRGFPLAGGDYQALANARVWDGALVCYETSGSKARVRYPASDPSSWW